MAILSPDPLTHEQQEIAQHKGDLFVQACPGSGKTRTIVERYFIQAQQLPKRHGIAVLSFTNVAVEEIVKRCSKAGRPELTRFPNYIGTFDSFVARYLVAPFGTPDYAGRPTVLDSWARLGVDEIRPRGVRSPRGVSLDDIVIGSDGKPRLDPNQVHWSIREQVKQDPLRWERPTVMKRLALLRRGYMTCQDARFYAVQNIHSAPRGVALGRALAARFHEVIVDETQDCNSFDLEILTWLRTAGVRVVALCDRDQAIYEFRGGRVQELDCFARQMPSTHLTGNFRSSAAICTFAATLRSNGQADNPVGRYSQDATPIVIIVYGKRLSKEIGDCYLQICQALKIAEHECVCLAHQQRHSMVSMGQTEGELGGSKVADLASAKLSFDTNRDARTRLAAIEVVEKSLLRLLVHKAEENTPNRVCADADIDPRWLRRAAFYVLTSIPPPIQDGDGRGDWLEALWNSVESLQPCGNCGWGSVRKALPRPRKNWPPSVSLSSSCARALTIHKAKGQEYEGVLLVVPPNTKENRTADLLDAWKLGRDSEAKRVLYVGATRARRLLALALPQQYGADVERILTNKQVPLKRHTVNIHNRKSHETITQRPHNPQ